MRKSANKEKRLGKRLTGHELGVFFKEDGAGVCDRDVRIFLSRLPLSDNRVQLIRNVRECRKERDRFVVTLKIEKIQRHPQLFK